MQAALSEVHRPPRLLREPPHVRGAKLKQGAHLQQLRHDGQHLWVADVDGIVPVGLLLVADVSQVEDG